VRASTTAPRGAKQADVGGPGCNASCGGTSRATRVATSGRADLRPSESVATRVDLVVKHLHRWVVMSRFDRQAPQSHPISSATSASIQQSNNGIQYWLRRVQHRRGRLTDEGTAYHG
jgi:hypothetical protein